MHNSTRFDAHQTISAPCTTRRAQIQSAWLRFPDREFWADVQLAVNVEVVTQSHEVAAELFAETILMEANGCQGSSKLLLRRVVIDFPLRHV